MRYIFGGKIYYIAIFPPIQVGKWLWGENGSITPALPIGLIS